MSAVCCIVASYILLFTIKGREERTEKKQGNTAEKLRHNNIIYDYKMEREETREAGETAEAVEKSAIIILKKV